MNDNTKLELGVWVTQEESNNPNEFGCPLSKVKVIVLKINCPCLDHVTAE